MRGFWHGRESCLSPKYPWLSISSNEFNLLQLNLFQQHDIMNDEEFTTLIHTYYLLPTKLNHIACRAEHLKRQNEGDNTNEVRQAIDAALQNASDDVKPVCCFAI